MRSIHRLSDAIQPLWQCLSRRASLLFSLMRSPLRRVTSSGRLDGMRPQTKQLLDASTGGKIKLKTPEEATELIENMSANDHAILRDRTHQPTKKSLLDLSSHDALLAQNKLLSKNLEILTKTLGKMPTKLSIGQPTHSYVL